VLLPDGTVKQPPVPESEVAAMMAQGMPPETLVNPGVEDAGWKSAGEYGIGVKPAVAEVPAASTPAGAAVRPAWLQKG
jgi:hypothetical protein